MEHVKTDYQRSGHGPPDVRVLFPGGRYGITILPALTPQARRFRLRTSNCEPTQSVYLYLNSESLRDGKNVVAELSV